MADTVRTKAQLLALFADNHLGLDAPQQVRDLIVSTMAYFDGTLPNWGGSVSGTEDVGGIGRLRLGRSGFVFKGEGGVLYPSNVAKKAGTILQVGDYPGRVDPDGYYVGTDNAMVFLTMNDLPSEIGGHSSHVLLHIRAQNSAAIPNIWAIDTYVTNEAAAGATPIVIGFESGVINKGTPGAGSSFMASSDRNVGTTYAGYGYDMASGGAGGGFIAGLRIDGIIAAGAGIRIKDSYNAGLGMAQGVDLSLIAGSFSDAAVKIKNADHIKWLNSGGASDGMQLWEDASNIGIFRIPRGDSLYFQNETGSKNPMQIKPDDAAYVNFETAMLLSFKDHAGAIQSLHRVRVGAADSGGTGYRNLIIGN